MTAAEACNHANEWVSHRTVTPVPKAIRTMSVSLAVKRRTYLRKALFSRCDLVRARVKSSLLTALIGLSVLGLWTLTPRTPVYVPVTTTRNDRQMCEIFDLTEWRWRSLGSLADKIVATARSDLAASQNLLMETDGRHSWAREEVRHAKG